MPCTPTNCPAINISPLVMTAAAIYEHNYVFSARPHHQSFWNFSNKNQKGMKWCFVLYLLLAMELNAIRWLRIHCHDSSKALPSYCPLVYSSEDVQQKKSSCHTYIFKVDAWVGTFRRKASTKKLDYRECLFRWYLDPSSFLLDFTFWLQWDEQTPKSHATIDCAGVGTKRHIQATIQSPEMPS